VKISGGGRCNVTHACFDNKKLASFYPRGETFLKKVFYQFNNQDLINWFINEGIKLYAQSDNRMFPESNDSQTIIDCLISEQQRLGIEVSLTTEVLKVQVDEELNMFKLTTNDKNLLQCDKLIVTTGGISSKEKFNLMKTMGHNIIQPVPSLFTFKVAGSQITQLQGLTVKHASIKIEGFNYRSSGAVLITHWGFSGPAVIKLSSFAAQYLAREEYNFNFRINWLANYSELEVKEVMLKQSQTLVNVKIVNGNPFEIPSRLFKFLISKCGIDHDKKYNELSKKEFNKIIHVFCNDSYIAQGKATFKEEFVTCGGIDLKEIDYKTMQSKKVKNLYFAGEVLNIDGITGGFNFQAAYTTGYIAGTSAARIIG